MQQSRGSVVPAVLASLDDRRRIAAGIAMSVLAVLLFTFMDSIGKHLSQSYPVQQVVWGRYFFHCMLMLGIVPWLGMGELLRTRRLALQAIRGLLLALATMCLFTAVSFVPLADAYTISFTTPLIVTILSIPMLGEKVGWRRWSAVLVGFAGVLIVARPGLGLAHWALLLPLVTATCFAFYQILTRMVGSGPGESPFAMLFYLALFGTLVMSLVAPFFWQPLAPSAWAWMVVMGALAACGHLILIWALALVPASIIAPFGYSQIIWALIIGYLIFGDLPDLWMLVGCGVIVASGLFVVHREMRRRR